MCQCMAKRGHSVLTNCLPLQSSRTLAGSRRSVEYKTTDSIFCCLCTRQVDRAHLSASAANIKNTGKEEEIAKRMVIISATKTDGQSPSQHQGQPLLLEGEGRDPKDDEPPLPEPGKSRSTFSPSMISSQNTLHYPSPFEKENTNSSKACPGSISYALSAA